MKSSLAVLASAVAVSGVSGPAAAWADSPVGSSGNADKPRPGALSAGDRLFPYLGNGGYDVDSYDVRFDHRTGGTMMDSSVQIKATAQHALSRFSLDSAGQEIKSVSVQNARADFRVSGEKLIITPGKALKKGQSFRVDIAYRADRSANPPSPAHPGDVPNFGRWVNHREGFALLGQPDRAHLFFPMNDHPSDKARVTFRITVPKNLQAAANGTLQSRKTSGSRTTYTYSTRDPIPTHVVQAAVGRFKEFKQTGPHGLPLRSFVAPEDADDAKNLVDLISEEIEWFENRIGSRYPFEAYGVLGVKGPYAAALEGATLSTYNSLSSRKDAPAAHELAHQYFGNAVSLKSWDDMWISEGHASFYSLLHETEKGYNENTFEQEMRRAYDFDREERGEVGPPGRLKSPLYVLGSTNAAGAAMLYGLRQQVGEDTFRKIERKFFDTYRHKAAATQDYIDVVNEVTGRDFTGYIKSWIYGEKTPPMPGLIHCPCGSGNQ
ncbi:M1 family metallopeptidase [Streptomyces olivoreticuli]|uniref:M1 family metallopeptidase n=1 Tax=Streptomyces olivoreticuli TaxID=68246 RepID=UPI00265A84C9|nr:M1 family metallopeptidase [Streptomyces olivoreticuli]WKK24249.1 M1 family metallopeptidase [Streptomyces olivoreticuli]